jgi:hypothetical protein
MMAATELLCRLLGVSPSEISVVETIITEIELFWRICEELKQYYLAEKENDVLNADLLREVVNDIIKSEEYSLQGIALYMQTSEEIICDLIIGRNRDPSMILFHKLINLHRSVRPALYAEIMKKIIAKYLK